MELTSHDIRAFETFCKYTNSLEEESARDEGKPFAQMSARELLTELMCRADYCDEDGANSFWEITETPEETQARRRQERFDAWWDRYHDAVCQMWVTANTFWELWDEFSITGDGAIDDLAEIDAENGRHSAIVCHTDYVGITRQFVAAAYECHYQLAQMWMDDSDFWNESNGDIIEVMQWIQDAILAVTDHSYVYSEFDTRFYREALPDLTEFQVWAGEFDDDDDEDEDDDDDDCGSDHMDGKCCRHCGGECERGRANVLQELHDLLEIAAT